MEDSLSLSSLSSYVLSIESDQYEKEEEAAEALEREKQIEEKLKNAFDDLSDSSDDDDDSSQSSDEESTNSSHQKSQSYADHSSDKESFESEEKAPNETSNLLSLVGHLSDVPEERSQVIESEYLHHSDENNSNNFVDHRTTGTLWSNENLSELDSNIITNGQHAEFSTKSAIYNEAKRFFESVPSPDKYLINSSVSAEHIPPFNLEEEYMQLQILSETRGIEINQMKIEELKRRQTYDQEIKSLKLKLDLIKEKSSEKERLCSALKESRKLISDFQNENNILKGNLAAIELQFLTEKEAKENVLSELQRAEVLIHSLDQHIKGQSEDAIRLQDQSEIIVESLKLRHQKEVLQLKEEIDKLQENLNSKDVSERLKCSSANEEKLYEDNKYLKNKITELLTSHTSEKISAVKLKVIKLLNDGLHNARNQCIKVFGENKLLQPKFDSILKPKEYEEMEKEIKTPYQNRLSESAEAKSKWEKLRHSLRDVFRRKRKCMKSGAPAESITMWKFQKQMEFLQPQLANKSQERNINKDTDNRETPSQNCDSECLTDVVEECQNSLNTHQGIKCARDEDQSHALLEILPQTQTPTSKKIKKDTIFGILKRSMEQHKEQKKLRLEERKRMLEQTNAPSDSLYHFFLSIYKVTKNMPLRSQFIVKNKIFSVISEMEATLLNIPDRTLHSNTVQ